MVIMTPYRICACSVFYMHECEDRRGSKEAFPSSSLCLAAIVKGEHFCKVMGWQTWTTCTELFILGVA